jgi:RNA polymerase sigma-70 factor, ECF subfamily
MQQDFEQLGEQIVTLLPRLRRFGRALCGDAADADDLVQLTVERALVHAAQLRPDSQLSSWLFGILRNAWIDERRSRARRATVLSSEELGDDVADPASDQQVEMLAVQAAMARLPREQREVVALVLVEGLSYREAAAIMNVPIGTVTSRLARAREALQALLAAEGART